MGFVQLVIHWDSCWVTNKWGTRQTPHTAHRIQSGSHHTSNPEHKAYIYERAHFKELKKRTWISMYLQKFSVFSHGNKSTFLTDHIWPFVYDKSCKSWRLPPESAVSLILNLPVFPRADGLHEELDSWRLNDADCPASQFEAYLPLTCSDSICSIAAVVPRHFLFAAGIPFITTIKCSVCPTAFPVTLVNVYLCGELSLQPNVS